jgi:hypothetical protein
VGEVPRQFLGLARDLIRRVDAASVCYADKLAVLKTLNTRMKRHRLLRPESIIDFRRAWREKASFRLDFQDLSTDKYLRLMEMWLMTDRIARSDWQPGTDTVALVVSRFQIRVDKVLQRWAIDAPVTISLHALGRCYERGGSTTEARVTDDLRRLAEAAGSLPAPDDRGFVRVPNGIGVWVCELGLTVSDTGKKGTTLVARTFLLPTERYTIDR